MKYQAVLSLFFWVLLTAYVAHAQQPTSGAVLKSADARISSIKNGYYFAGFCFKPAPKTDTSSRDAKVLLFDKGPVLNDSLKSFIVFYPDSSRTEAFDGRYYFMINHRIKTIQTVDITEKGLKKSITGWAGDFAFLPFLRKKERHFLPGFYERSTLGNKPAGDTGYDVVEYIDSTLNDWKIAEFDPDYIVTKTVLEVAASNHQVRSLKRWVTFMASPQYEEAYFSDISPLPDSAGFLSFFDVNALKKAGYIDYAHYKAQKSAPQQVIAAKTGDTFPDFQLPTADNRPIRSDSLTKGLLLFDFWYRSCYPCLKALPVLQHLHEKYADKGLTVLGINPIDPSFGEVKQFLTERKVTYSTLMDPDRKLAQKLAFNGYPTIFLVDAATKKILFMQNGYSEDSESVLENQMKEYMH